MDDQRGTQADAERRARLAAVLAAVAFEGLERAVGAGSAGGADAQFGLQFVEARAAAAHFALDLAIGDPVADTDDHDGRILMRIVPILHRETPTSARVVP